MDKTTLTFEKKDFAILKPARFTVITLLIAFFCQVTWVISSNFKTKLLLMIHSCKLNFVYTIAYLKRVNTKY
jgi:hypothetical protein